MSEHFSSVIISRDTLAVLTGFLFFFLVRGGGKKRNFGIRDCMQLLGVTNPGQIITICCWTDILSVETKFQLCMVGHNTKMIRHQQNLT